MNTEITKMGWRDRRKEILRIIEEIGLWNINKSVIARKFGVNEGTVRLDIKRIIKEIPPEEIQEPKYEIFKAYKKAMKEARKMLVQGNDRTKAMAIGMIVTIGNSFIKFMEDYGYKEKVAERVEIDVLQKYIEEARLLVSKPDSVLQGDNEAYTVSVPAKDSTRRKPKDSS